MTIIYNHSESSETLWMETEFCKKTHWDEQILIGFTKGREGEKPHVSIVLYGMNKEQPPSCMWGQIYPNMEEVDIIIDALQEAKQKALEIGKEKSMGFVNDSSYTDFDGEMYRALEMKAEAIKTLNNLGYRVELAESTKEMFPDHCPYCNSKEVKLQYYNLPNLYRIKCKHCGLASPSMVNKEKVISFWDNLNFEAEEVK